MHLDIPQFDRRALPFHAPSAGRGKATWGQSLIADDMSSYGDQSAHFNIGGYLTLDAPRTVDEVSAALALLLSRIESLRTTIHPAPGGWEQVSHRSGRAPLMLFDSGEGLISDPAEGLVSELAIDPFDMESDFPVRLGLVLDAGMVAHVAYVFSHTAIDAAGVPLFESHLRQAIGMEASSTPVGYVSPIEEAEFQQSDSGRRVNELALAYWEDRLRRAPTVMERGPGNFRDLVLSSPWLSSQAATVAHRLGATSASVLFAAVARATARHFGRTSFSAQLTVSNRFRPRLSSLISPIAMEGFVLLDEVGGDFATLVERSQSELARCYRFAYFDKRDMLRVAEQVAVERGAEVDLTFWYNDIRPANPLPPQLRGGAAAESWQERATPHSPVNVTAAVGVYGRFAEDANGIEVILTADTESLPRDSMRELLAEVAAVIGHESADERS